MSSNYMQEWSSPQEKQTYRQETLYSLLVDSTNECNTICGNANETCFTNCIKKNQQLFDLMRDQVLYSEPRITKPYEA